MDELMDTLNAKLKNAKKYEEFHNYFSSLQTDEDRVIYTLKLLAEYKLISEIPSIPKSAEKSESLRSDANRLFVVKGTKSDYKYMKILGLYTKSIAYAPIPSKELALAYGNRSAVLFEIQQYKECIADIDRALEIDSPDNIKAKLYVRKAQCLDKLNIPSVGETFEKVTELLGKISLNDSEKLKEKIKHGYMKSKTPGPEPCKKKKLFTPPVPTLESQNPEFPCASDAITVAYDEEYGRHVVATRKIEPGEVLCIEKPYTMLLKPENVYNHCTNCLNVCWVLIPCDHCTYAMYCSVECKVIDWEKYHDIECPIFPILLTPLNMSKLDLFTLRIAIKAVREYHNDWKVLKEEMQEVDKCRDPRTKGFSADKKFHSDVYRSVYSLATNTEKRTVHNLFRRAFDTCFILYYVATRTDMFGEKLASDLLALAENKFVTFVGGLILRHQQMVPVNCHSFTEEHGLLLDERGIAVLPFLSLMNHSCNSNIVRNSMSDQTAVYALLPIEEGEQVFDNYGPYYAMTSLKMRRQVLSKQYFIDCKCEACIYDWPMHFGLPSYTGLVDSCYERNLIAMSMRKFSTYVDIATAGNVFDKPYILKDLLKMIKVLHAVVRIPTVEMNEIQETVKRVYGLSGNQFGLFKN